MKVRMIKVGGSLLRTADCSSRLGRWWHQQPPMHTYWMAGGGEAVDVIRHWDRTFRLGDQLAFTLTLDALQLTRRLMIELLQRSDSLRRDDTVLSLREAASELPERWQEEYRVSSWEATSDTLAALIARWRNADELVILKACPVPQELSSDLRALAKRGIIDNQFENAVEDLPIVRIESLAEL